MERGKTLRDLVIESGLTHEQIARAIGVQQPRISALLNAPDMKISTAVKLSKVLGVSLRAIAASLNIDIDGIPDDRNIGGNEDK
jgi:plasmid maintenance system antidote protein VapI